jgi:GNAT superfamily N-acetyltransferase
LTEQHDRTRFSCGMPILDEWLARRALPNQVAGASRTYVACEDNRVVGYYALAAGSVEASAATGRFRRNMPAPIPVALLARLAIDREFQGHGLGRALLRDAARRLHAAADILGVRGLLVHALSDDARRFYVAVGFDSSPLDPLTLMISMVDIRALMAPERAND